MNLSFFRSNPATPDLLELRQLIGQLAPRCGLDLADRAAVRGVLNGDFARCPAAVGTAPCCQDLRAMLVLLYRLEASSSEDLGIDGLGRLWHQHGEILARFRLADRPGGGQRPEGAAA